MKRLAITFTLLGLVLVGGCSTSPNFLVSASPVAQQEADLYRLLLVLSAVVFVIVEGLLLYNILYHGKKPSQKDSPPQHYRQYAIEAIYTAIPTLAVIGIFIVMLNTMQGVAAPASQSSDLIVHVIGHRWWWEFDYPDLKIKTANELHIPVNATIQIDLDSMDVIHSFYVPQLSGKTDVIPGNTNHMWLHGDTVGAFHGQCAEYCGLNHANMRFTVFVDTQTNFDAWVANQQKPPPDPQTAQQKLGQNIIINGVCAGCHDLGTNGPGNATAPDLTHLMSRQQFAGEIFDLNEANLRRWLQNTEAMKPGNDMNHQFSPEQIDALISYLRMLK